MPDRQADPGSKYPALTASRHRETGHVFFPEIPANFPVAEEYEAVSLSPNAVLYSFTIVHPSPKSGQPPFTLAYADFPEGVRVMGRLTGETPPRIGAPIRVEVDAASDGQVPSYSFVQAA